MAMYKIPDPEELVECPYDTVHMVRAKRMQYHLMKCRNNYKGRDYASCPFNARHEMPKPELRYHLATCPDRAMLEPEYAFEAQKQSGEGSYFKGCTDVPAYDNGFDVPRDENWDEETPNIARIGIDRNYLMSLEHRNLAGMSNAEKRQYKAQLILPAEDRQNLEDEGNNAVNVEQKLRLPHQAPRVYVAPQPPQPQVQPTVFSYSLLSMAGVGRGQVGGAAAPGDAGVKLPGRGRGLAGGASSANTSSMPYPGTVHVNGYSASTASYGVSNGLTMPAGYSSEKNIFSMGIGRGAMLKATADPGAETPSFVVPSVRRPMSSGVAASMASAVAQDSDSDAGSSKDTPGGSSNEGDSEDAKNKKKLLKKLRQIEGLSAKLESGAALTTEEEIKLSKRDELLAEMQQLRL